MSSELFETKEDDFKSSYDKLLWKINDSIPKLVGEEKKKQIRDVERSIEDATLMIHEMEEELKRAPNPFRMQMLSRVRSYKSNLSQLTQRLEEIQRSSRNTSSFSRDNSSFEDVAASDRARLISGGQTLSRTSESIARSHRIAAETDEVGHGIINELGTQREQLTRTRDRLIETDQDLSRSRKILKGMGRKLITNKVFLIFMIVLEVIILGGVIYWKFFS